jgi:hypothetical protein
MAVIFHLSDLHLRAPDRAQELVQDKLVEAIGPDTALIVLPGNHGRRKFGFLGPQRPLPFRDLAWRGASRFFRSQWSRARARPEPRRGSRAICAAGRRSWSTIRPRSAVRVSVFVRKRSGRVAGGA